MRRITPVLQTTAGEPEWTVQEDSFLLDVIAGLDRENKCLPPKYFYDQRGSEMFDEICGLQEYYLYQAELALLPRVAREVQDALPGEYALVEFGAGSLHKVKHLLDTITGIRSFIPIDISGEHLRSACEQLQLEYPALQVRPVEADFSRPVTLMNSHHQRLGFFPGSTIGNFSPAEAELFLHSAGQTLGPGSPMLIGVDTKKSPAILHAAYNDEKGVTAAFNRNILQRINRELNADIDINAFHHYAFYNPGEGRMEMHLMACKDQRATIGSVEIVFREGESIHTENSYKYTTQEFKLLAHRGGWQIEREWLDADHLFATYLIRNSKGEND